MNGDVSDRNHSNGREPVDGRPEKTRPEHQQLTDEDITLEWNTSNLIIGITNAFNSGKSYREIIMSVLDMISEILHPDRLLVFERGEETTRCSFEWCAEGVPARSHLMQDVSNAQFDTMAKLADDDSPILTSNINEMESVDERMAQRFNQRGISRMMAIEMTYNGEIIGYISANNYRLEKGIDAKRVLDTVAPFICTKIVNQRLVDQLELASIYDGLTGLFNRRGIDDAIEQRLAEYPDAPYALALMDIDDFKVVNDLYGHDVGDEALRSLAGTIKRVFPESAILGRNGGDEFLAMVFGDDMANLGNLLGMLSSATLSCELNGKEYPLSMSMGYAEYPLQAANLQDAYTKADAALYSVKLAGKSGFKKYAPEDESRYRSQLGFTPRDLAENAPCGILVCKVTPVGEILFANDEVVDMFECESFPDFMEYTGGTFEGIVHPDDRSHTLASLMRQHGNSELGGKSYLDFRIVTKRGTIKHVADSARLIHSENADDLAYVLLVDKGERERFMRLA